MTVDVLSPPRLSAPDPPVSPVVAASRTEQVVTVGASNTLSLSQPSTAVFVW